MLDLSPEDLALVRALLLAHVPDFEVRAFGSRVRGTARPYSDLDLVLIGGQPLCLRTFGQLQEAFQESNLTFRVDIIDWHQISDSFRAVINERFEVLQQGRPQE